MLQHQEAVWNTVYACACRRRKVEKCECDQYIIEFYSMLDFYSFAPTLCKYRIWCRTPFPICPALNGPFGINAFAIAIPKHRYSCPGGYRCQTQSRQVLSTPKKSVVEKSAVLNLLKKDFFCFVLLVLNCACCVAMTWMKWQLKAGECRLDVSFSCSNPRTLAGHLWMLCGCQSSSLFSLLLHIYLY